MKFRPKSLSYPGQRILTVDNVSKSFDGGETRTLDNVSMSVTRGEILLITGQSGSGKTTLLRTIEGIEGPDMGTVNLFNHDLYKLREHDRSKLIARYLGIGIQAHCLDTGRTTRENLKDAAKYKRTPDVSERYGKFVVALGLTEKREQLAANLSGGEKQRVALGRLLIPKPELILLDEPTASIDPAGKESIYALLREVNQEENTSIVMISHDDVARKYADRELVVDSGRIVAEHLLRPPVYPAA